MLFLSTVAKPLRAPPKLNISEIRIPSGGYETRIFSSISLPASFLREASR